MDRELVVSSETESRMELATVLVVEDARSYCAVGDHT